ncbi:phosphotransferase [Rhizobium beringeri]
MKSANIERCEGLGRVMAQIHSALARKAKRKVSRLPSGLIHGALVPDNIFFLGNEVRGVINFRLRHEDYLVSEIAGVLVNWALGSDGGVDPVRGQALLRGYQTERVLTAAEKDALSGFVLASAARVLRRQRQRGSTGRALHGSIQVDIARYIPLAQNPTTS